MDYLSNAIKLTKIIDQQTATTDTQTSSAVDMAGYTGALFFTSFGTANDGNYIKLQASSDDASSDDYGDIAGSKVATGTSASNEDVWIDIKFPTKRYLKCLAVRGASSTLGDVWVIQYGGRSKPVTNTTTGTITGEQTNTPAEGTA